ACVLGNYYIHYAAINHSMETGGAIPMPYSHIRYTLILAFAFFFTVYLLEMKELQFSSGGKWIIWSVAAFVFLRVHILSVRSGLLGLYLGIFYLVIREIIKRKRFLIGAGILITLIALPFLANRYVPSFHHKMEYMHYDLEQYNKGIINEYSDAMRI